MPQVGPSAPRLHRPLGVRCVNALGGALEKLVGKRPTLDENTLTMAAIRRTGLRDFGSDTYRAPLGVLLESLQKEAALNTIGRIAASRQVVDALATRLALVHAEKQHAATTRITRPVFVLGLPRTGTTLLHGLLAADPSFRSPRSYEVARPIPDARARTKGADPRIGAFDADIDAFRKLAPGIDAIHPMGARLPQECLLIMAYELMSMQFELCFHVPTYQAFYLDADLSHAYGLHRRFLGLLGADTPQKRWVLKSPAHLGSLDALFREYPDAVVIQTHRDPVKVLASVSSLHFTVRGTSSDATDARAIGREQTALWSSMLARTVQAREQAPERERFIHDVLYRDLVADPIAVVKRIYAHIGERFTPDTDARMRRFLADNARDKHGTHRYDAASFGLDPSTTRARFGAYMDRFEVPREGDDDDARTV